MVTKNVEERRLLTILFADLSGFTALSSKLDPEDVREVASTCFEFLNKPIVKQGGTIHKYEGDLVIALFGFPVAHEDDPERAIRASLDMMNLMPEVNNVLLTKLKKKTDIGLHMGINIGTVVVGEIGSKEKKEHTIMGDAVNLASRLKDVAKRGEIIVSEPIFRTSRYLFDYKALKPVSVKGIDEPLKIFRPMRLKENPEPKRGVQGLYSPMVGRDEELKLLNNTVERLSKGKGGVFFILGGAGLGKSRLLAELKKLITNNRPSITILEGRCLSYGDTLIYWPFLQILENFFEITEDDSRKIFQEKLIKKTKEIFPDNWGELIPYLGYLFSIRFADEFDEKVKYLDAKGLKIQIMASVRKLLDALSRIQPLLLIVDDYHWIDSESLELLEFIFSSSFAGDRGEYAAADDADTLPILFLGLSRIEKDTLCFKTKGRLKKFLGDDFQEIVLKPLEENTSNKLIYNLLDVPGFPEGFKDKILQKAEGNPFYLEEIIRSLIDSGILYFSSGVWHLVTSGKFDFSTLKIPDTIQAVIATRLDKLEQDVRDVLQMAAVIGRNFYGPILERLCQLDSLMLTVHLATLEDYEYISEHKKKPELEYIFRHPLFQEVTYNSLLKSKRRELHRKVGEHIENIYKDRLDELTDLLAHQYANSDNLEKAVEWLVKAGKKTQDRYANDEAIKYFQQLISIINEERLEGKENDLCLAYEALGDIYSLKGEYDPALKSYEEMCNNAWANNIIKARSKRKIAYINYQLHSQYDKALQSLEKAENLIAGSSVEEMVEKVEIYILRGTIYRIKGDMERAAKQGEMALNIADELMHLKQIDEKIVTKLRAVAMNKFGYVYHDQGNYNRSIEMYQKAYEMAEAIGDKREIAVSCNNLGIVYKDKNEYDKAIELFQRCLKITKKIGDWGLEGAVYINLGTVYTDTGEDEKAVELYQRYLDISEAIGDIHGIGLAVNNLGIVYKDRGEFDKATDFYKRFLKISEEIGSKPGIATASSNLGNVYCDIGEYEKALELHETHLRISKETGDKIGIAAANANLGVLYQELGEYEKALESLNKSLKICEEAGEKQGKGFVLTSLGIVYLKIKEFEKAGENLAKAETILEEIGDKTALIEVYINLAQLKQSKVKAANQSSPDKEALTYIGKALKLAEELKLKPGIASGHFTYGKLYAAVGDFKKAENYLQKAIMLFNELRQRGMLADTYLDYAQMLKQAAAKGVHLKDMATEYYTKARNIYEELKLPHKIKECDVKQQDK